jgi:hypothetical protein
MPQMEFEPTILAFERAKTVHALDRVATVTGFTLLEINFNISLRSTHLFYQLSPPVSFSD